MAVRREQSSAQELTTTVATQRRRSARRLPVCLFVVLSSCGLDVMNTMRDRMIAASKFTTPAPVRRIQPGHAEMPYTAYKNSKIFDYNANILIQINFGDPNRATKDASIRISLYRRVRCGYHGSTTQYVVHTRARFHHRVCAGCGMTQGV